MFDFTNQVIMITGASGNLGAAVARTFYESSGRLALVDALLKLAGTMEGVSV